jgi:superfamily I DNA and/or RNA helicase
VTPYRAQADELQKRRCPTGQRVRVGTAHTFQGGERDVVVLSPVAAANERAIAQVRLADRQHELWNVAITRARSHLVVVQVEAAGLVGSCWQPRSNLRSAVIRSPTTSPSTRAAAEAVDDLLAGLWGHRPL